MPFYPMSFFPPQFETSAGVPASGYVLKAYADGTSANINMYTDKTGGTSVSTITLNASGYPEVSGSIVIPHIDQDCKIALYPTSAAALADSGAIWSIDYVNVATASYTVTDLDLGSSGSAGSMDIFPSTASKGKIHMVAANNAADYTITITNASFGQAATITLPDPGTSAASYVLTESAQTINGSKTFSSDIKTSSGLGAVNGTGVSAVEYGDGIVHKTVVTFLNTTIALTDEAGVVAYGGLKFYDMPEGHVCVIGAVTDLNLTKSSAGVNDDWDGDFSVGTVTASNNATLTSTEANIIPSTATPQAVAGATTADGQSTSTECPAYFDGTATATDIYINFLVDDTDHNVGGTACNLILNGTLTLTWINLGDN